ncbi:MAG: rod shape-determining protein MreC [Flavobacteriaceae bacterium]|nr:rod shape-determining protein MreC [Flavobacteriaceae bacterium]
MNILIAIWKQFKTFIVFLLLEGIAIGLLLSLNSYQNSYLFQTTMTLRSNLLHSFSLADDYLNLYSENRKLVEENSALTEKLKNTVFLQDSMIVNSKQYHYIPAKIAHSTIVNPDNYLVINKGKKDKIKAEMAVVSSKGLVGIVYAVSEDYASVLPLINTSFSCLVAVQDTTLGASTSWSGADYRYIDVKGVPLHLQINKNDSIFTNNTSTLYPSRELIGTVTEVTKADLGKSFSLQVKLATNFATLQNVYVIENKHKVQIDSLLQNE